jgi:hypothetical protein
MPLYTITLFLEYSLNIFNASFKKTLKILIFFNTIMLRCIF